MCATIFLWITTKRTNNDKIPRKKSQENADTKIEDSHPYKSELVVNIPKYWISKKIQANFCWVIRFHLCKYLSNVDKNYITMIAIKTDTIIFILLALVAYIRLSLAVKKDALYLPFLTLNAKT